MTTSFSHRMAKTQNFKGVSDQFVCKNSNTFQLGHELTGEQDMSCFRYGMLRSSWSNLPWVNFTIPRVPPQNDSNHINISNVGIKVSVGQC